MGFVSIVDTSVRADVNKTRSLWMGLQQTATDSSASHMRVHQLASDQNMLRLPTALLADHARGQWRTDAMELLAPQYIHRAMPTCS